MIYYRKHIKFIAVFLCLNMVVHILIPTASLALTSGPSQPEFSSFEPVATTNMVNTFTGDFTYNIPLIDVPGPHGSGYPISLSYHSGVKAEEEASWVGYGWTLNAGAINRNTRGLPDDFNGEEVTYFNRMPKNWTATLGGGVVAEVFGSEKLSNLSGNVALRYNNYKGFGYSAGIGLQLAKGAVNLGYGINDGEGSFSLKVNPFALARKTEEQRKSEAAKVVEEIKQSIEKGEMTMEQAKVALEREDQRLQRSAFKDKALSSSVSFLSSSSYGLFSFGSGERPGIVPAYTGQSINLSVGLQIDGAPIPVGVGVNAFGTYTHQTNDDSTKANSYGLMYSALATTSDVMDYHVEKESSYNKRDVFLGVPINDADVFVSSAEGISGGFRMYHKEIGSFGPKHMSSKMDILNIGAEIHIGTDVGPGVDLGDGEQKMTVGDWERVETFSNPIMEEGTPFVDEPVFFRFNNDLGGSWGDPITDAKTTATTDEKPVIGFDFDINNGQRSGRSSYIDYTLNKDMLASSNGRLYQANNKRSDLQEFIDESESGEDKIGEFAVTNESGNKYVYGLPVRNRNEGYLSYGMRGLSSSNFDQGNYIAYSKNDEVKLGSTQKGNYAGTYLLTEITNSDYIDRTNNGPTLDDFGGYTKFNYTRIYGGDEKWYKWRTPYQGLKYQRNELSDQRDDLGSVSYGEKEVFYLESIETKTHIAVFELEDRNFDSFGAESESDAIDRQKPINPDKLKRLKKIHLFSRGALISPIKRAPYKPSDFNEEALKSVILTYEGDDGDFSKELMKNAPNSASGRGKLTLKSVQTEYNGVARISPYYFYYEYPTVSYPEPYGDLANYAAGLEQNPPYEVNASNAWGNYQPNGVSQHQNYRSWIDQSLKPLGPALDNSSYDPAVWNLKVITLPSGGQIHVQYEADDYAYVQNKRAHVMAQLTADEVKGDDEYFKIDHTTIGLDSPEELEQLIKERYIDNDEKMYFKFLYKLKNSGDSELSSCNVEFISGYADVAEVKLSNGYVEVKLRTDDTPIPFDVCKDYIKANRMGRLSNADCSTDGLNDGTNPEDVIMQLANFLTVNMLPKQICQTIRPEHSYLRVPTPKAKIGGGVRVKRLLTFDNSLDESVLYGNEYSYETIDTDGRVISSGVATNEPQSIREENILVHHIRREGQTTLERLVAGKDKKQSEGPIGESVLPGASVGYSKVITSNIYKGQSSPGYYVEEFHTAKSDPVIVDKTPINASRTKHDVKWELLKSRVVSHQFVSQGFSIILNNMHGQQLRSAYYPGYYIDQQTTENTAVSMEQVFKYYKSGEKVPVKSSLYEPSVLMNPGREVDVTVAQKAVEETSSDVNIEFDGTLGLYVFFVIPFTTFWPFSAKMDGKLYTHATTKVIRYPAIQQSVTTYQDGIYHTSVNMAFDKYTGKPVSVKTDDEFKGSYINQSIPASWEYKSMQQKANLNGLIVEGNFNFLNNSILFDEGNLCEVSQFSSGDLIELELGSGALYHVDEIDYVKRELKLIPTKYARFFGSSVSRIAILEKANTNQLLTEAGQINYHFETDQEVPPVIDARDDLRYKKSTYAADFESAIANQLSDGEFILTGPYENQNISIFSNLIDCQINPSKATIRNVTFFLNRGTEYGNLTLRSLEYQCGNTWNIIE